MKFCTNCGGQFIADRLASSDSADNLNAAANPAAKYRAAFKKVEATAGKLEKDMRVYENMAWHSVNVKIYKLAALDEVLDKRKLDQAIRQRVEEEIDTNAIYEFWLEQKWEELNEAVERIDRKHLLEKPRWAKRKILALGRSGGWACFSVGDMDAALTEIDDLINDLEREEDDVEQKYLEKEIKDVMTLFLQKLAFVPRVEKLIQKFVKDLGADWEHELNFRIDEALEDIGERTTANLDAGNDEPDELEASSDSGFAYYLDAAMRELGIDLESTALVKAPKEGAARSVASAYAKHKMMARGPYMSVKKWVQIMKKAFELQYEAEVPPEDRAAFALDYTYNDFNLKHVASVLAKFQADIKVAPAREYSVAIYVKGEPDVLKKLKRQKGALLADEVNDASDGSLRFWWD